MEEIVKNVIQIGERLIYPEYLEDGILYLVSRGDADESLALKVKETSLNLIKNRGIINILVDVNHSGNSSSGARKVWKELTEHEQVGKVAFVGLHMVARVIAGFIMSISGNKKIKFFSNKEDALSWFGSAEL